MKLRLFAGLAAVLFSFSAFAQVTVYSGIDAGAGPADSRPNSDAARASLIADFPIGPIAPLDFEDLPIGGMDSGPLGQGVTLTSVNQDTSDLAQGITTVARHGSPANVIGYNTTADGRKYLGFVMDTAFITTTMVFSFDVPIQAFGTYLTGVGTAGGDITLNFDDGSAQTVPITGAINGGVAFYGFTDPGKDIASVEFRQENAADIFGFDDMVLVQNEDTARFHVTKFFSDGSEDEVDVAISCNNGLPSSDSATITGGDEAGHTFVITRLSGATVNCEITESGSPDGYVAIMNGGEGCSWENVLATNYECVITNEAEPGEYTVTKQWFIYNEGGDFVNQDVRVTIACDRRIFNKGAERIDGTWFLSERLGDGESMTALVRTENRPNVCMASERITESGVESESEGNCDWHEIGAGESSACTFINTVFFEGIPTLSQYGLAILALLMLGVGMVGFRRFV